MVHILHTQHQHQDNHSYLENSEHDTAVVEHLEFAVGLLVAAMLDGVAFAVVVEQDCSWSWVECSDVAASSSSD